MEGVKRTTSSVVLARKFESWTKVSGDRLTLSFRFERKDCPSKFAHNPRMIGVLDVYVARIRVDKETKSWIAIRGLL